MTKEELKKEADDYADKHAFRVPYDGSNKFYDDVDFKASREGYLAGAEPREKRIEELEKENAILKGRTEEFEKQILGLLYKYESVYKRFPDLKDAMSEAERVLKENTELKEENRQLANEVEDLNGYCNQIGKIKTDVLKLFEHIVAR